ncbi:MAG: PQQ-dependent sugar dehydrogenase [Phycisphaerales bacterium]|nr:PQQ-dependent sugar dehydrogenase [Phycisphaerales bacterium]MCI0674369.1 PQQ-dependent sugar dehydrogenase [Phycisphaerales bacterium]
MKNSLIIRLSAAMALSYSASSAFGGGTPLTTVQVTPGLVQPLYLTHAPGDFERLFVIEKAGKIRIIKDGVLLATPFLNIDPLVNSTTLEWGMLGMTFHPEYASNGYFFINYIENTGDSVIARYKASDADPDIADPTSGSIVLYLDQPNANHRGGWLAFGVDGYLYDSQGDGGGQNDPSNRAQNINLLQGKILRLDVDGPDNIPGNADDDAFPVDANKNYSIPPSNPFVGVAGADEIWHYGLRNPWRCSFDRLTHDLYIGDVGQNQREEISFQAAATAGPINFGWRCTEGTFCTGLSGCLCNGPTLTGPIHEYNHSFGVSVTGGYVYRGCAIPDLQGTYFFADYQSERIWSFRYDGAAVSEFQERTAELDPIGAITVDGPASFGEDAYGELYITDYNGGEIFKIVPASFVGVDCNSNQINDACDILDGLSDDKNGNGVPDECEPAGCPADLDSSGSVDVLDLLVLISNWSGGPGNPADLNGDGIVNVADLLALISNWGPCV